MSSTHYSEFSAVLIRSVVAATLAVLLVGSAAAAPITFNAQAQVFAIRNDLGLLGNFLASVPMIDDIISVTLTFDPDTLGMPVFAGAETVYYPGGVQFASITAGATTLQSFGGIGQAALFVSMADANSLIGVYDGYGYTIGANGAPDSNARWAINLTFLGGMLESLDPPTTIPDLDQFAGAGMGFRSFDTAVNPEVFDSFSARILSVQAVPLPGSAWLLITAFAGLGGRQLSKWRQASKASDASL